MDLALKALEIKLSALVTLEVNLIFETFRKVLFKVDIFRYETPTISKRVLHVGKDEPDTSPPQFAPYEEDVVRKNL